MEEKQRGGARKGAGRKPGVDGPTIVVAASIPETLLGRLDALAAEKGWNRSKAVTEAVRRLVKSKR